jgi:hypothetical protein
LKHFFLLCLLSLAGCSSVEVARVKEGTLAVPVQGEPIAVIQANSIGFTLFFHAVDVVKSDLDDVINRLLLSEAKAMGANKVQLLRAHTTPRAGVYAFSGIIFGFPESEAVGIAVK